MTYVVLDIGAGSRAFGADLKACNPKIPMLVLCGEPHWGIGPFFKAIPSEGVGQLLRDGSTGVKRIISSYERFEVPDESLDLVTLNSPHPLYFMFLRKMYLELRRCLKPGGLFFSSFPAHEMATVPKDFVHLQSGRWGLRPEWIEIDCELAPTRAPVRFPQSTTLRSNIREHAFGDPASRGSSYIYFDGISPGWNLWQKPL